MARGHSTTKTSMDAKCEALTESSVSAGTLAETKPLTASLDSRKSRDSTKGKLQTAAMVLTIVSSDSGTSHTHPSSQPMSHLSFSRKIDILQKGQVTSVSVNTLIAGATSLATDPSYLSSNTAPAVNISLQSQREIQADHSVSNDPSVKTQTDDVEETPSILQSDLIFATALLAIIKGEFISYKKLLVASRGRNRTNECNNKSRPYAFSDSNTLGIIFAASIPKITCSLYLSYNCLRI